MFLLYRGVIDYRVPLLVLISALLCLLLLPVPVVITDNAREWRWLAMLDPSVGPALGVTFRELRDDGIAVDVHGILPRHQLIGPATLSTGPGDLRVAHRRLIGRVSALRLGDDRTLPGVARREPADPRGSTGRSARARWYDGFKFDHFKPRAARLMHQMRNTSEYGEALCGATPNATCAKVPDATTG
jgi:hypothetical protein